MKTTLFIVVIFLSIFQCTMPWRHALSGSSSRGAPFDTMAFKKRHHLAQQLALDDVAAWKTSDTITAHSPVMLDSSDTVWFVYPSGTLQRKVYYGSYNPEQNIYTPHYAFSMSPDRSIHALSTDINNTLTLYSRSVFFGVHFFTAMLDSLMLDFKFNHYVRHNQDSTFSLWFFPAGSGNYCAYGTEFHLILSPGADSVLSSTITGSELKYIEFSSSTNVSIDNSENTIPTTGNIVFAILYARFFSSVSIVNTNSVSIARASAINPDSVQWEHINKK